MTQHSIQSFSDPNRTYIVRELPNGELRCSCPAFVFSNRNNENCKHIRKFLEDKTERVTGYDTRLGMKIIPNEDIPKGFKKKNETHILVSPQDYDIIQQTPTSKLYMALLKLENIYEDR